MRYVIHWTCKCHDTGKCCRYIGWLRHLCVKKKTCEVSYAVAMAVRQRELSARYRHLHFSLRVWYYSVDTSENWTLPCTPNYERSNLHTFHASAKKIELRSLGRYVWSVEKTPTWSSRGHCHEQLSLSYSWAVVHSALYFFPNISFLN